MHQENSFVTLTYSDKELPAGGSLDRRAFPLFMKRLRKQREVEAERDGRSAEHVSYFHCGEYGSRTRRPHYHALLFGVDFPDKEVYTVRVGLPVYRSKVLEVLWPFGLSEIGSVTFESAAYVARYTVKKLGRSGSYGDREKEYCTMSRRPWIGRGWIERYASDVYPHDQVVMRGQVMKPPRAYDRWYEEFARADARRIFAARLRKVKYDEQRGSRLYARREVRDANPRRKERGL